MNINILDTTLRDGEQTPGVSLTPQEKLRIATKLDEIGVEFIEAGSAITSHGERESIKQITKQGFNAEILSFSRPLTVLSCTFQISCRPLKKNSLIYQMMR